MAYRQSVLPKNNTYDYVPKQINIIYSTRTFLEINRIYVGTFF